MVVLLRLAPLPLASVPRSIGLGLFPALLFASISLGTPARGQETVSFDFDDPPETNIPITEHLSFGVEVELDGLHSENLDLDGSRGDKQTELEPIVDLAFTYQPNEIFRSYVDVELARREVLQSSPDGESDQTSLTLVEAYVTLREIVEGVTLQVGRQQFQDELQWYFDEELDGARAYLRFGALALEPSISQGGLAEEDFLNKDDSDDVTNAFLIARYALNEDAETSSYFLFRDGHDRAQEDLVFVGLQSFGELADNFDYWVNAAYVTGTAKDDEGRSDVEGVGLDLFATYAFERDWEPSVTLGVAFGSGGGDKGFRQTGLQENEASFNGETRFKYYGEALNPELSNLGILTAGVGVKPSDETSLDLVYHYYWQAKKADELRDSNLETEPQGDRRDLGHGLDLIFGLAEYERIDAKAVAGVFLPGRAFASGADPALFLGFELQYAF